MAAKNGGTGKVATVTVDALAVSAAVTSTEGVVKVGAGVVLVYETKFAVVSVVVSDGTIFSTECLARFWARFFDAEPMVTEPKDRKTEAGS